MSDITAGMKAPDFTLKDFQGRETKLSDYLGKKMVVLVLLRGFG